MLLSHCLRVRVISEVWNIERELVIGFDIALTLLVTQKFLNGKTKKPKSSHGSPLNKTLYRQRKILAGFQES